MNNKTIEYTSKVMENLSSPHLIDPDVLFEIERAEVEKSLEEYAEIIGKPYTPKIGKGYPEGSSSEVGEDGTIFVDAPLFFGNLRSDLFVMFRIENNNDRYVAIIENITTP